MSYVRSLIPWSLNRTVDPTVRVLTLDELKHHLRVTWDEENDRIEDLVLSAEEAVADELSKALTAQTWVLRLDAFPCWEIRLPRPTVGKGPYLNTVTSVQYIDDAGATQILDTSTYTKDEFSHPGRIHLAYSKSWPTTRGVPNAVIITYTVGKTTGEEVPEMVRDAIKLTAADLYVHRERSATDALKDLVVYERLMANHRCIHEFRYV